MKKTPVIISALTILFSVLFGFSGCGGAEPAAALQTGITDAETAVNDTAESAADITEPESVSETSEPENTCGETDEAEAAGFSLIDLYRYIKDNTFPIKYSEYIEKYAEKYSVSEETVYAVIKAESNFRYDAVSSKNASGLMQLTAETYEWLCKREGIDPNAQDVTDPETNIMLGTSYLAWLYGEFGEWETVFAAYNAGQGIVRKWLEDERYSENGRLVSIPFKETAAYVAKVIKARDAYADILRRGDETD